MNARRSLLASLLCLLSITAGPGCGAGKAYDIGRKAEERGDSHLAHDYYVQAGVKRPGNAAIRDGLKRTAPSAVVFWRKQASVAMKQERYDDAWRMLMRALSIRPNSTQTLAIIRKIETEHGTAIASAKADYLRRGIPALQVQLTRLDDAPPAPTMPETTELANVTPEPQEASQGDATAASESIALVPADESSTEVEHAGDTLPPGEDTSSTSATAKASDRPFTLHYAKPSEDDQKKVIRPTTIANKNKQKPTKPTTSTAKNKSTDPMNTSPVLTEEEYSQALKDRQTSQAADNDHGFIAVRTYSRKNDRFPKQALLIDGITLKLKDTDDELDADLNLYKDGKRFLKIRDLQIGRSRTFTGKSGTSYRLTILSIHHKSHTVRIGVSRA